MRHTHRKQLIVKTQRELDSQITQILNPMVEDVKG